MRKAQTSKKSGRTPVPVAVNKSPMSKTQMRFHVLQKYDAGWTYQGILDYYHMRGYALSTTFIANALREREALHPELKDLRHVTTRPPVTAPLPVVAPVITAPVLTAPVVAPPVSAPPPASAPVTAPATAPARDPWLDVLDLLGQVDGIVRRLRPTAVTLEYDFLSQTSQLTFQQVMTQTLGPGAGPSLEPEAAKHN
jgi:hypothetical protein